MCNIELHSIFNLCVPSSTITFDNKTVCMYAQISRLSLQLLQLRLLFLRIQRISQLRPLVNDREIYAETNFQLISKNARYL